eukprot:NODE_394_length_9435_cov_0.160347.p8 type:complete len:102 gc:universal NODE_394_length_9435_cov_0.160347:7137-7442(+)
MLYVSVDYLIFKIDSSSCLLYLFVLIINNRSSKSIGIPCGLFIVVPRIVTLPLLLAMITIGANSSSSILLRKEKHSMSNMCTSSMNNTPGSRVALPSSIQV